MQQKNKEQKSNETVSINLEESEELDDSIPGTPPSKKFKAMFFSAILGKMNKTTETDQPKKPAPVVLVEDSESD